MASTGGTRAAVNTYQIMRVADVAKLISSMKYAGMRALRKSAASCLESSAYYVM